MVRPASYYISLILTKSLRWFSLLLLSLIAILGTAPRNGAQSIPGHITIEKGGRVWIEGSAGMINYSCKAEALSGAGQIENTENPQATVNGEGDVNISVTLPVKALDCGKRAMNKDMYEALKSDSYPNIQYQLLDAELANTPQPDSTDSWMNIRTRGIMEIAGVQDTTGFMVQGKILSNQRFQVKGQKQINMDTYHIKPPSAMFGLIRADKNLSVHFDVTVHLQEQSR